MQMLYELKKQYDIKKTKKTNIIQMLNLKNRTMHLSKILLIIRVGLV